MKFMHKKSKSLETINLRASKLDVYIQITLAKDKPVFICKSTYIKVTL